MLPSPATSSTRAVDDCAPMDMLARLFEARGWPFAFESDDEVGVQVQGSWGSYQLRAIWRRHSSQFAWCSFPARCRYQLYSFLQSCLHRLQRNMANSPIQPRARDRCTDARTP